MGDAGIGFADHGDLRYCITQANTNAEPSNVIKFHRGLGAPSYSPRGLWTSPRT